MTGADQQEFLRLLESYVVASYSDRLSEYVAGGVVPRVIGSRPDAHGAIAGPDPPPPGRSESIGA